MKTISDAVDRIAHQKRGQMGLAADRDLTDPRVDRLLFGPATRPDVEFALVGWSAGSMAILLDGGVEVDPLALESLGEGQALFLPAQTGLDHRGGLRGLVDVVDRLLDPNGGCPWDLEQTHQTLKKYLIEEAYELFEAIDREDEAGMIEELGDVLLQPIMHTQIAMRRWAFDVDLVAQRTAEKLVRRHPHVFGDASANTSEEVLKNWDKIKKEEKGEAPASLLGEVPASMPALLQALTISKRAARAGFEWPEIEGVFEKLAEEVSELREAMAEGDAQAVSGELGDLLFTVVNLARWLKVDPEEALRGMLARFSARFRHMERESAVPLSELDAAEWDRLWVAAKGRRH